MMKIVAKDEGDVEYSKNLCKLQLVSAVFKRKMCFLGYFERNI